MQPHADRKCCIPSCIKFIDMFNKIYQSFEFGNGIMCLNGIDILRKYEFRLDYIHDIPNDSTRRVQNTNMNPMECIQCINSFQCLKHHLPLLVFNRTE